MREVWLEQLRLIEPGDFKTWEASLERAVAAEKPVILPLWKPYYLDVVYSLRVLADPKNVLGPANRVVLGAGSDVIEHIDAATVEALQSIGWTLDIVSELDRCVRIDGQFPDEAAVDWVSRNVNSRR